MIPGSSMKKWQFDSQGYSDVIFLPVAILTDTSSGNTLVPNSDSFTIQYITWFA